MSHPSHSSVFDNPDDIWWKVQTFQLLVMQSSSLPCYLVPVRPKYLPKHPILDQPQLTFLPQCGSQSFTPMKTTGKIIYLCIVVFV
jgi:hypothetical protein